VRILAFVVSVAFALGEVSADLNAILVELGLGGLLGFLLVASSSTATTTTRSAVVLGVTSLAASSLNVLVLAFASESALASLAEVAADFLLAAGVLRSSNSVRGALVAGTMQEAASLSKSALLLLGPIVAVSLGGVVSWRGLNCSAGAVLVLAVLLESARAVVSEGSADFFASCALGAWSELLGCFLVVSHLVRTECCDGH